jgi:hypothetical protein
MRRRIVFLAVASLGLAACGGSTSKSSSAISTTPATTIAPVAAQSTYLNGNAHPTYPPGTAGKLSVVYQAPISPQPSGTSVPIVFRNDTDAGVAHVNISASATDATGKIVGSGSSQGTDPSVVQPGQWAYAFIYFQSGPAATDKLSHFSFDTSPADASSYNTAPIQVTQANPTGAAIAGGVENTTGHTVMGPISVNAYCLNPEGNPTSTVGGFTSGSGDLAPKAVDSFQLDLNGQSCPSFLVGASGYYK